MSKVVGTSVVPIWRMGTACTACFYPVCFLGSLTTTSTPPWCSSYPLSSDMQPCQYCFIYIYLSAGCVASHVVIYGRCSEVGCTLCPFLVWQTLPSTAAWMSRSVRRNSFKLCPCLYMVMFAKFTSYYGWRVGLQHGQPCVFRGSPGNG